VPARRLEQGVRAVDVRADEGLGVVDRAVDVGLGGEVHDDVDPVFGDGALDGVMIADVRVNKPIARIVGDVGQVREVAGIRQLVEDDDDIVRVAAQHVMHEVGADETGAPRHHQSSTRTAHHRSPRYTGAVQIRSPQRLKGRRRASASAVATPDIPRRPGAPEG
jgi:hypothetical protein